MCLINHCKQFCFDWNDNNKLCSQWVILVERNMEAPAFFAICRSHFQFSALALFHAYGDKDTRISSDQRLKGTW